MRIAVYDTGIGGLAALRQCLLIAPGAHWHYIADEAFFPAGERSGSEVRGRLRRIADTLRVLAVDVVVPAASVTWPYLDTLADACPSVVDPVPALAEGLAASQFTTAGFIAPPAVLDGSIVGELAGHRAAARASSLRLAGVVERDSERDQLTLEVVRDTVREFASAHVEMVVPLDSHAALVADLIKRFAGGVDVLDTPQLLANALARTVSGQRRSSDPPRISLHCPVAYSQTVRAVVREHLQVAEVEVRGLELSDVSADSARTPTDIALLAYAAFDAGSVGELAPLIAPYARHRGEDADLLTWLMRERERCGCRHIIGEILTREDTILMTGLKRQPDGRSTQFGHELCVRDGRIVGLVTNGH